VPSTFCLLKLEKVGLAGDQVPSPERWNQVRVRAQQLVGQQNQDLLLEQVVDFNDENVVILDHSVCSKVTWGPSGLWNPYQPGGGTGKSLLLKCCWGRALS